MVFVKASMVDQSSGRDTQNDNGRSRSSALTLGRTARNQSDMTHKMSIINPLIRKQYASMHNRGVFGEVGANTDDRTDDWSAATGLMSNWAAPSYTESLGLSVVSTRLHAWFASAPKQSQPQQPQQPHHQNPQQQQSQQQHERNPHKLMEGSLNVLSFAAIATPSIETDDSEPHSLSSASSASSISTSSTFKSHTLVRRKKDRHNASKSQQTAAITGAMSTDQIPAKLQMAMESQMQIMRPILEAVDRGDAENRTWEKRVLQTIKSYYGILKRTLQRVNDENHIPGLVILAMLTHGVPCFYKLLPDASRERFTHSLINVLKKMDPVMRTKSFLPNVELTRNMLRILVKRGVGKIPALDPDGTLMPSSLPSTWELCEKWIRVLYISGLFDRLSSGEINQDAHSNPIKVACMSAIYPSERKIQQKTVQHLKFHTSTATEAICLILCIIQCKYLPFVETQPTDDAVCGSSTEVMEPVAAVAATAAAEATCSDTRPSTHVAAGGAATTTSTTDSMLAPETGNPTSAHVIDDVDATTHQMATCRLIDPMPHMMLSSQYAAEAAASAMSASATSSSSSSSSSSSLASSTTTSHAPRRTYTSRRRNAVLFVPTLPLLDIFDLLEVTPSAVKSRLDGIYRNCLVCHDTTVVDGTELSLDDRMLMCGLTLKPSTCKRSHGKTKIHAYLEHMGTHLQLSRKQSINSSAWRAKNAKKLEKPDQLKAQQSGFRTLRRNLLVKMGIQAPPTIKAPKQTTPALQPMPIIEEPDSSDELF